MVIHLKKYSNLRHFDLTPFEEIVYLDLAERFEYAMDISPRESAEKLGITHQYYNRALKSLQGKGYVEKIEGDIIPNLDKRNLNTISTKFILDEEIEFKVKTAILNLYDQGNGQARVNIYKLKFDRMFTLVDLQEALEFVSDEGYWLIGEKIDFNRIFTKTSRYDD